MPSKPPEFRSAYVSVVIPTLNAGDGLQRTLAVFANQPSIQEILVVDGGSKDETRRIAEHGGARVIECEPGRGVQLLQGGQDAKGAWLLFLHGDTVLSDRWPQDVENFINRYQTDDAAAVFSYALDDNAPQARRVERMVHLRCRLFALPYGDQGLLISKRFYESLGGYKPIPLMEDVNLIRRIGRRRLHYLEAHAVTSAVRYHRGGYWWRPLLHLFCLGLYFLGVSPKTIAKLYR